MDLPNELIALFIFLFLMAIGLAIFIPCYIIYSKREKMYRELEEKVLKFLDIKSWDAISIYDDVIIVKSRASLDKYDEVKYFKEDKNKLQLAQKAYNYKSLTRKKMENFLQNNEYVDNKQYNRLVANINKAIYNAMEYRVYVKYISRAGNLLGTKTLRIYNSTINKYIDDPTLLMTKGEYSKFLKEKDKDELVKKQQLYYDKVNEIIDFANDKKSALFVKGSVEQLDKLIEQLFDRTVNSIKKIKNHNSEEFTTIGHFISGISDQVKQIVDKNQKILDYYNSSSFQKIKETCSSLMNSQLEFNEYISEKVQSISKLFGTRVIRSETINNDEYQYIRPYKKTLTPFSVELSSSVFASAENNTLEYVVKYFYSDKSIYPEQIQKLHLLIEELSTLKDAKKIIENYKKNYDQYIGDVPNYVMDNDEVGFYSRLGLTTIEESDLVVEYKFSYTSDGGKAKRSFVIPMTEETIVQLIKTLEGKLTISCFTKEQRMLMTNKLREFIKKRDNYTCKHCGNSTYNEPNLLLEIDHIIPVSKGGCTSEENLQTLCWKCNRTKGDKII